MPKKDVSSHIVDRAVGEKVTKERAGLWWYCAVEKVLRICCRRKPRRYVVHRELWGVQDRNERKDRKRGKASAKSERGEARYVRGV